MSAFILTLPSNASSEIFPDNSTSEFRTQLSDRIYLLREHYEVALMQISYIHSIKTFSKANDNKIQCIKNNDKSKHEVCIPNVSYTTLEDLVITVNQTLSTTLNSAHSPKLQYNKNMNRISLITGEFDVHLSNMLAAMLGFHITFFTSSKTIEAKLIPDIRSGRHSMYIYCDLVESQYVGDKKAPLLRELPLIGSEGEAIVQTFALPFYIPLRLSQFDTIHIRIADESGDPIIFEKGNFTATLHLRPS